jgi:hypothetical protein
MRLVTCELVMFVNSALLTLKGGVEEWSLEESISEFKLSEQFSSGMRSCRLTSNELHPTSGLTLRLNVQNYESNETQD